MLKMFKNVTESVSKIAVKMEETDQVYFLFKLNIKLNLCFILFLKWFEEKTRQVENLYVQFKKMHSTFEMLYGWRRG